MKNRKKKDKRKAKGELEKKKKKICLIEWGYFCEKSITFMPKSNYLSLVLAYEASAIHLLLTSTTFVEISKHLKAQRDFIDIFKL